MRRNRLSAGLTGSALNRFTMDVGQAILPAAAFQAALSGHARAFVLGERRLKAGCSQDWLPHLAAPEGLFHDRP